MAKRSNEATPCSVCVKCKTTEPRSPPAGINKSRPRTRNQFRAQIKSIAGTNPKSDAGTHQRHPPRHNAREGLHVLHARRARAPSRLPRLRLG